MNWLRRGVFGTVALGLLLLGTVSLNDTRVGPIPAEAPGFRVLQIDAPSRPEGLSLHVWYPSGAGPITLIGQNALFFGFHARRDAVGDGLPHPVVLLSHGSGGNAERLGWIGAALAARGMIVAAVNHPGTTSGDSLPARTVMPWERMADLVAVLDHLQRDPPPGVVPNMARVGALGFSLGGGTVLLASGVRLSKASFQEYCVRNAGNDDCGWLAEGRVDLDLIDRARYEQDNRDPRIKAVVAVDPALSQAMRAESLARLPAALIVNLGSAGTIPLAMRADDLAAGIPGATYLAISGTHHFGFLARCSLLGVIVIALASDDNICSDWGLRDRDAVHAELARDIGGFLAARLQGVGPEDRSL